MSKSLFASFSSEKEDFFFLPSLARRTALLSVAGLAWAGLRRGAGTAGTLAGAEPAPPLALADDRGGRFDLLRERGRVVLVTFGYTRCPDVCPTILGSLAAALDRLGGEAAGMRTVFVTLDPLRDTAAVLRPYLAAFAPADGAAPLGLTDAPGRIAQAARDWRVSVRRAAGGAFLDHTAMVAAVAPDGRLRLRYGVSQLGDAGRVAADLHGLLRRA